MRISYVDKNKTIYNQQVHKDSDVVVTEQGKAYSVKQLIGLVDQSKYAVCEACTICERHNDDRWDCSKCHVEKLKKMVQEVEK